MKAMREALEAALKTIRGVINGTISPRSNTVFDCRDKLSAALALPRRQCDVGTAEEQTARYDKFCNTNRTVEKCCTDCPALGVADCELAWAQMPYEKGETDGGK